MSKIKESFDQIHADARMVSSTQQKMARIREMEEAKKRNSQGRGMGRTYWRAACALAMIAVMIMVGQFSLPAKAVSYVSIDAIPSLEFSLDSKNRVVSAEAYNEDGQVILEGLKLKGLSYEEALKAVLEDDDMQTFLKDDEKLVISFVSDDEKTLVDLQSQTADVGSSSGCHYKSEQSSHEALEEAHAENMSFGKYEYYLRLKAYDEEVEPEDFHHKSMGDMENDISSHSEEDDSSHESTHESTDASSEDDDCSGEHESGKHHH